MIPAKYNVDFSSYQRDFTARAQARLLQQFQGKPVLAQVVAAFARVKQQLYDAALAVLKSRAMANAGGAQLAALGRILGQPPQFIPESQPAPFAIWGVRGVTGPANGRGWNQGWWDVGGSGVMDIPRPPTDPEYSLQVLAAMHRNMNRFSSIPEIQAAVLDIFGINISFTGEPPPPDDTAIWGVKGVTGPANGHGWNQGKWFAFGLPNVEAYYLVVPSNTSATTGYLLQQFVANQRVDALPFIAWPVTFAIKGIIYH